MNIRECKTCLVINCKRPAERLWQPDMSGKPEVPVSLHHFFCRKLWWYKGAIYDHTEEEG